MLIKIFKRPGNLLLFAASYGLLLALEQIWPLRQRKESKLRRHARNLAIAALSSQTILLAQHPLASYLTSQVEARRWGVLKWKVLPSWLETLLAVVLLDYTLYLWHAMAHRTKLLWRIHQFHHSDLDMDVSTALRFHFMEMLVSLPWRALQIVLVGVNEKALLTWQKLLLLSIMFHHSNVRLPLYLERWLGKVLVTPRMHGIHHSLVASEAAANLSSGLVLWDKLHGSQLLNIHQQDIEIGLAFLRQPHEVKLSKVLTLPFRRPLPKLVLPDGHEPSPSPRVESSKHLLAI